MSPTTDENSKHRTQLFSVVGAAYVPEDRAGSDSHQRKLSEIRQPETGVAVLWLVFYVALIGIGALTSGGAAKLVEFATVMIK